MKVFEIDVNGNIDYIAAKDLPEASKIYHELYGVSLIECQAISEEYPKSKWGEFKIYDYEETDENCKPLYICTMLEAMNDNSVEKPGLIASSNI